MIFKKSILLYCLLFSLRVQSQEQVVFKNFILKDYSYATEKILNPEDTFAIKKYVLININSDTLYLFQKVALYKRNEQWNIFEGGLGNLFLNLRKDSCYTIFFESDKYGFIEGGYLKNIQIDFLYTAKDGSVIIKSDKSKNLILHKIQKIGTLTVVIGDREFEAPVHNVQELNRILKKEKK